MGDQDHREGKSLLQLAEDHFKTSSWTPAEKRLLDEVHKGKQIYFRDDNRKLNAPRTSNSWGEERSVGAKLLEWLCTDKAAQKHVHRRGIRIAGVKVEGRLDLESAEVPFAIELTRCALTGSLDMWGATLRGLSLSRSEVRAVRAGGARIETNLVLNNGFVSHSEVRLVGAKIKGDLVCSNARLNGEHGRALTCDRMEVSGSVFLKGRFEASGEVRMVGASVQGSIECDNGRFRNPSGVALNCDGIRVQGDVYLRGGLSADGVVTLAGASILGWLFWTDIEQPQSAVLDLRGAQVGTLVDDDGSWPESGNLYLDGFHYDHIADQAPMVHPLRLEWLRRQPVPKRTGLSRIMSRRKEYLFSPQPYEQAAKVLRGVGHDRASRKIQIAKNWSYSRHGDLFWLTKLARLLLLGPFIGFGFRPGRALGIGLLLAAIGWGLFHVAGREDLVQMRGKDGALVARTEASRQGERANYEPPDFHPLLYSLDVFLPVLSLGQEKAWSLNPRLTGHLIWDLDVSGFVLGAYAWGLNVIGWLSVSLFIAGATGVVSRRL